MKKKTRDKTVEAHKMIKEVKHNQTKRDRWAIVLSAISSLALTLISILLASPEAHSWAAERFPPFVPILIFVFGILGVLSIFLQIYNGRKLDKLERDYLYYEESKKVSTALLSAIKRTDFDKTCSILQSTYGHVPDWHPIDYCQNVLVYDIHQHLRSICIRLKELIVSLAPDEFNDDMVTVDIAYSYPSDDIFEPIDPAKARCKVNVPKASQDSLNDSKWRIITSGDHTSAGASLQEYLNSGRKTFYNYLKENKYEFGNDKRELNARDQYEWSRKDLEYGKTGSIIGKVIDLRNDTPEIPFVEVYLTITTYGRRLVEENDPLTREDFERLFKETVINSYKTLIETELAQMFVRHGIRDGFIDRSSGKIIYPSSTHSAPPVLPSSPAAPSTPPAPTTPPTSTN